MKVKRFVAMVLGFLMVFSMIPVTASAYDAQEVDSFVEIANFYDFVEVNDNNEVADYFLGDYFFETIDYLDEAIPFSSPGTIQGTVRSYLGCVGIAGANVALFNQATGARINAVTNAQGEFTFENVESGTYRAVFHATGRNSRVSEIITVAGGTYVVGTEDFTVGNYRSLIAVTGGAFPIVLPAGAFVVVAGDRWDANLVHLGGRLWHFHCDGTAEFPAEGGIVMPIVGGWDAEPWFPRITDASYVQGLAMFYFVGSAQPPPPAGVISGTVRAGGANSAVRPGVNVSLFNVETAARRNTTTNADGFFQFNNVANGTYRIIFHGSAFSPARSDSIVINNNTRTANQFNFFESGGSPTRLILVVLDGEFPVEPAVGTTVRIQQAGTETHLTHLGGRLWYTRGGTGGGNHALGALLPAAPNWTFGPEGVFLTTANFTNGWNITTFTATPTQSRNTVTGTVPSNLVNHTTYIQQQPRLTLINSETGVVHSTAPARSNGQFSFTNVPNGTYRVMLTSMGAVRSSIRVDVNDNSPVLTPENFGATSPRSLIVALNYPFPASPPAGATVTLAANQRLVHLCGRLWQLRTTTNSNVPTGGVGTVEPSVPDWAFIPAIRNVVAADYRYNLAIISFDSVSTAVPPPPISGTVRAVANGPGIANAHVTLFSEATGQQIATTTTNASGFYYFAAVPNGRYTIVFHANGRNSRIHVVNVNNNTPTVNVSNFSVGNSRAIVVNAGVIPPGNTGEFVWLQGSPACGYPFSLWGGQIWARTVDGDSTCCGGFGTLTPSIPGWNLSPQNATVNAASFTNNLAFFNFTATQIPPEAPGTVSGTARSTPMGAGIPGAIVVALNRTTGQRFDTITDQNGFYRFTNLPNGVYWLDFSVDGHSWYMSDVTVNNDAHIINANGVRARGVQRNVLFVWLNGLPSQNPPGTRVVFNDGITERQLFSASNTNLGFWATDLHVGTHGTTGTITASTPGRADVTVQITEADFTNRVAVIHMDFGDVQRNELTASPAAPNFGTVTAGYAQIPEQTVTITNTGNTTTTLWEILPVPNWVITPAPNWEEPLEPGGTRTFTIRPENSLAGSADGTVYSPEFAILTGSGNLLAWAVIRPTFTVTLPTNSISGVARESRDGPVLANVNVSIFCQRTGVRRNATTDANGFYLFDNVPNGSYWIFSTISTRLATLNTITINNNAVIRDVLHSSVSWQDYFVFVRVSGLDGIHPNDVSLVLQGANEVTLWPMQGESNGFWMGSSTVAGGTTGTLTATAPNRAPVSALVTAADYVNYIANFTLDFGDAQQKVLTATPEMPNFGTAVAGYAEIAPQTITITNTGNIPATLNPLPPQPNWVLTPDANWSETFAPGETRQFTLRPETGLAGSVAGAVYRPTIPITAGGTGTPFAFTLVQPSFIVTLPTNSVSGTVRAAGGGTVSNANVAIFNQHTGARIDTTTNENGFYLFENVPNGQYWMVLTKAGRFVSMNGITVNNNAIVWNTNILHTAAEQERVLLAWVNGLPSQNPTGTRLEFTASAGETANLVPPVVNSQNGFWGTIISAGTATGTLTASSPGRQDVIINVTEADYLNYIALVQVDFAAAMPIEITASPATLDFGTVQAGYSERPAQTVTVENTGTVTATLNALPVVPNWVLAPAANWATPMEPGESRTFTIRPANGLAGVAVGTVYSPTITISAAGGFAFTTVRPTFTVTAGINTISGTISASPGGLGIEGAHISKFSLTGTRTNATTNQYGFYQFTNVPNGTYWLYVTKDGHELSASIVTVNNNAVTWNWNRFVPITTPSQPRLLKVWIEGLPNQSPPGTNISLTFMGMQRNLYGPGTNSRLGFWSLLSENTGALNPGFGEITASTPGFPNVTATVAAADYVNHIAFVTLTFGAPNQGISAVPANPFFGFAPIDTPPPAAQTITVTNTGGSAMTMDALPTVPNWVLTPAANWATPFNPGETRTFTLRPQYYLEFVALNEAFNVTANGGAVSARIHPAFSVSHPPSTIRGTVREAATGPVVPGATVTLLNLTTGEVLTTTTDARGVFNFSGLRFNAYHVFVTMEGRTARDIGPIFLPDARQDLQINNFTTGTENQRVMIALLAARNENASISLGGRELSFLYNPSSWFVIRSDANAGTGLLTATAPGYTSTPRNITAASYVNNFAFYTLTLYSGDAQISSPSPDMFDFGTHYAGYNNIPALTATITNTGNAPATMDALPSVNGWVLTPVANWSQAFAPGETRTFTLRPENGLAVGTHSPTIIVTANSGAISAAVMPTFTVAAVAPPVLTLERANQNRVMPGDVVEFHLVLGYNPGLAGMTVSLTYDDSILQLLPNFPDGDLAFEFGRTQSIEANPMRLDFESPDITNVYGNGRLVTVQFLVRQGTSGFAYVSAEVELAFESLAGPPFMQEIDFAPVASSGVNVQSFIYGDVDGSGIVNQLDVLTFRRFLAGDVNLSVVDGLPLVANAFNSLPANVAAPFDRLDLMDVHMLRLYLAGQDVTLGQPVEAQLAPFSTVYVGLSVTEEIYGEYLYVTISLDENPGVSLLHLMLNFDADIIEPLEVVPGLRGQFSFTRPSLRRNPLPLMFEPVAMRNVYATGTLATIRFKLLDADAVDGTLVNLETKVATDFAMTVMFVPEIAHSQNIAEAQPEEFEYLYEIAEYVYETEESKYQEYVYETEEFEYQEYVYDTQDEYEGAYAPLPCGEYEIGEYECAD